MADSWGRPSGPTVAVAALRGVSDPGVGDTRSGYRHKAREPGEGLAGRRHWTPTGP